MSTMDQAESSTRRNPRACEACRTRKTRCMGGHPCDYCRSSKAERSCHIREKARSRKATTAHTPTSNQHLTLSPQSVVGGNRIVERHISSPRVSTKNSFISYNTDLNESPTGCVRTLERLITDWAREIGNAPERLMYHDHTMFTLNSAFTPDPSTEASLMNFYVQSPERHFDVTDRQMVRSLHQRYMALPESLSEEQRALVYACLCRSSQLHGDAMQYVGSQYFALAWQQLEKWNRASVMGIGAGLLLAFVSMWRGGRDETRMVSKQICRHVRSMGWLQRETALLYPKSDQVGRLLTATIYLDTIVAGLCDELPHILNSELDWDPSGQSLVLDWPLQIMKMESDYYLHPMRQGSSMDLESMLREETKWSNAAHSILKQIVPPTTSCNEPPAIGLTLGWAAMRCHWLQLMLRIPLLEHPVLSASSWSLAVRAAIQIIRLYNEHASTGNLHACWISMLRLIVCSQLTLIACSKGHIHVSETAELLRLAIKMLAAHEPVWPESRKAADGFSAALGSVTGTISFSGSPLVSNQNIPTTSALSWSQSDMDPSLTATMEPDWRALLAEESTDIFSIFGNTFDNSVNEPAGEVDAGDASTWSGDAADLEYILGNS